MSGRGRYDRGKSKRRRRRETRARIIAATAELLRSTAGEVPTVSRITKVAGVGRNTFYALFRDARHARRITERKAVAELRKHLDQSLSDANTPVERLRVLAHAWIASASSEETLGGAIHVRPEVDDLISRSLQRRLALVLEDTRRSGITATGVTARRLGMVAAAWQVVARELHVTLAAGAPVAADLVDFTLRAFR